jgi:hypothetical protein
MKKRKSKQVWRLYVIETHYTANETWEPWVGLPGHSIHGSSRFFNSFFDAHKEKRELLAAYPKEVGPLRVREYVRRSR